MNLSPEAGPASTLGLLRYDDNLLILDGDAYHRRADLTPLAARL